jgi:predicted methyltransferase
VRALVLVSSVLLSACATSPRVGSDPTPPLAGPTPEIERAVAATDRTPEDTALDGGRKPLGLLTFIGVRPGQRVADLGAGGGYTTELLARVVGDQGTVFMHNPPQLVAMLGKRIEDRLARPANRRVVRVDRAFDDPLPPEARDLDLVVMNIIYHDTAWMGVDRARMNRAILGALRPGGRFVVADSSAPEGTGAELAKQLHRIERKLVRDEVLAAGFVLETESPLYRNPDDKRDWDSSPKAAGERRGTSDRFLLRFMKRK